MKVKFLKSTVAGETAIGTILIPENIQCEEKNACHKNIVFFNSINTSSRHLLQKQSRFAGIKYRGSVGHPFPESP